MSGRLADKKVLVVNLPAQVIPALAARLADEGARVIVATNGERPPGTQTHSVEHPGTDPSRLAKISASRSSGTSVVWTYWCRA